MDIFIAQFNGAQVEVCAQSMFEARIRARDMFEITRNDASRMTVNQSSASAAVFSPVAR